MVEPCFSILPEIVFTYYCKYVKLKEEKKPEAAT